MKRHRVNNPVSKRGKRMFNPGTKKTTAATARKGRQHSA